MLKKMPIRLRLTVMTVALLTVCCVGLTLTINFSATRMATRIDAVALVPSLEVGDGSWSEESIPAMPNSLAPSISTEASQ